MCGSLASIINNETANQSKIKRTLLRDHVTDLLRTYIVNGRIPPGTKLVERELIELLSVGRNPIRDALIELQKEGLVESDSNRRRVVDLSERDIREMFRVRLALETVAVELAAENNSPENKTELLDNLERMRIALAKREQRDFPMLDIEAHSLIWRQSDNRHLLATLKTIAGPIFMVVFQNAEHYDWSLTLELHTDLIRHINAGDKRSARESIKKHLTEATNRALQWPGQSKKRA